MLNFDEHGNLTPDQPIASDLGEVEDKLVFNEHRRLLFEALKLFFEKKSDHYSLEFLEIWLDGSFATLKPNPLDIDVVLFVQYQTFDTYSEHFEQWKKEFKSMLDLYFVRVYPESHPLQFRFESDRIYWLSQFSKDRKRRKKGLISIIP